MLIVAFIRGFLKENSPTRDTHIHLLNMKIHFALITVFIKKTVDFNMINIAKNVSLFQKIS